MKRVAVVMLVAANFVGAVAYCQVPEVPRRDTAAARAKRRANAEAEAEAKNKANRDAYAAECARLKTEHQEQLEKFKLDTQAYHDKVLPAYERDRGEYTAEKKLHDISLDVAGASSDGRAPTKQALSDLYVTKYRGFIKLYPGTKAAKDAAADVDIALKGGYVKVHKLPPEPVRPKPPVVPRQLKLPQPPEPVSVVYPPDLLEEERIERMEAVRREPLIPQADAQTKGRKAPANGPDPTVVAGGLTAIGVAIVIVCIVGGLLSVVTYFLPAFIAMYRGHPNAVAITMVCVLFGWSFLGWGIAMVWACTAIERKRPQRIIIEQAGAPVIRQPSDNPFDFS